MLQRAWLWTFMIAAGPAYGQTVTVPASDRDLAVRVENIYEIGRLEGAPWEVFGGVLEVEFGADGTLYVLDVDNTRVHSYDPQGRHRWSAGGAGAGPGELSGLTHMAVLPGGDVVIADFVQSRIVHFTAAGEHAGTLTVPSGLRPRRIHAAGERAIWFIPTPISARGDSLPLIHLTLDASARVVAQVPATGPRVLSEGNTLRRILPPTFSPVLRTASAGGRLVFVDGAEYRVTVAGGRSAVLSRALNARRVTAADREAARDRMRANAARAQSAVVNGFRTMPSAPDEIEEQVRRMTFADRLPVIQELRGAPDGTLWIARPGRVAFADGPIDIYAPDLRYAGTLPEFALPAALGPGGLTAHIVTTEEGVPTIHVRRLSFLP